MLRLSSLFSSFNHCIVLALLDNAWRSSNSSSSSCNTSSSGSSEFISDRMQQWYRNIDLLLGLHEFSCRFVMRSFFIFSEMVTVIMKRSPLFLGSAYAGPVVTLWADSWWRHQMQTFSALLTICVWNSPVTGEFPAQRPVTRSFDVFLYLWPNKRLSKQLLGWWFETILRPLWRHCNTVTLNELWSKTRACFTDQYHCPGECPAQFNINM